MCGADERDNDECVQGLSTDTTCAGTQAQLLHTLGYELYKSCVDFVVVIVLEHNYVNSIVGALRS